MNYWFVHHFNRNHFYFAYVQLILAGGKCLPKLVDIRYEDQVQSAVEHAVQKFGGIDILVNIASANSLTGKNRMFLRWKFISN